MSINTQPITIRGIQEHNPQIHCIYTGKMETVPIYTLLAEKQKGSALGTIFQKGHLSSSSKPNSRWQVKWDFPQAS
jgi:hypothetical protein